jgi:hypothetical protein
VGNITVGVVADIDARVDRLDELVRTGINEIFSNLMVVVDHDTGRLVWAAHCRGAKGLSGFSTRSARTVAARSPTYRRIRFGRMDWSGRPSVRADRPTDSRNRVLLSPRRGRSEPGRGQ